MANREAELGVDRACGPPMNSREFVLRMVRGRAVFGKRAGEPLVPDAGRGSDTSPGKAATRPACHNRLLGRAQARLLVAQKREPLDGLGARGAFDLVFA